MALVFKKGNRIPALEFTLEENEKALNCESPVNALAVKVIIKPPKVGVAAKTLTAEFVEKKAGTCRYKWKAADVESGGAIFEAGKYTYEGQVEWATGETENFPLQGIKEFEVQAQLE